MESKSETILGIESSCDETSVAIVRDGREVMSCLVDSQIERHRPYGGVVPEIASRRHVEVIGELIGRSVKDAGIRWPDVTAVAATRGPGLASSLLIGWMAAKGLAVRLGVPLIPVNHIEAHLHSVFLAPEAPDPLTAFPRLSLAVSGGHTALYISEKPGEMRLVGRTIDDAAGEAMDKAARLLGLSYPGGPEIDRLSKVYPAEACHLFPAVRIKPHSRLCGSLDSELCFSFSGLKTSLSRHLHDNPPKGPEDIGKIASEYQESIVASIIDRCRAAMAKHGALSGKRRIRYVACGGGVSANSRLRARLDRMCAEHGAKLLLAPLKYCGDNAAMIASLAFMRLDEAHAQNPLSLDIAPTSHAVV